MAKNTKDEVSQLSALAEEMLRGDFRITPVAITMAELAEKYNSAVAAQDRSLADEVLGAVAAIGVSEPMMLKSTVLGQFLRDAGRK